jgi:hypothetical protein
VKLPISDRVDPTTTIASLSPYVHVADVERSLAFYALLGLTMSSSPATPGGRIEWARVGTGESRLMLAFASVEIDAERKAVLFYNALRRRYPPAITPYCGGPA